MIEIIRRCPKCHGTISRHGKKEKPFFCTECKTWFTESEVTIPSTNANHIRSMSDEELAGWFYHIQDDISRYYDSDHAITPDLPCGVDSWIDWLKQEAREWKD